VNARLPHNKQREERTQGTSLQLAVYGWSNKSLTGDFSPLRGSSQVEISNFEVPKLGPDESCQVKMHGKK